ncbi:MAG TPA: hypothetical protein PLM93_09345 [Sulfuricurvum sp.]|nr:MAG: hypothetical protein B7X89_08930 [Sulfuricurvum sp. 17-40-25]HQS67372.1 hypothetical protein [Sulfuricurvum sp.]
MGLDKEPIRVTTDSENAEYFWAAVLFYIFAIYPVLYGTYIGLKALNAINILTWFVVFIIGSVASVILYRLYQNDKHWYALGLVVIQWGIFSFFIPDNLVSNSIKSIYQWGIS